MSDGTMIASEEEQASYVKRGLDRIIGHEGPISGWETRIKSPVLIGTSCDCMLAQLYGSYNQGLLVLRIGDDHEAYLHGFMSYDAKKEEPALNRRWERVLADARAEHRQVAA